MPLHMLTLTATLLLSAAAVPALALDADGMKKVLETIDERQRNAGDHKSLVYIQTKEKSREDVVMEAVVYRRDASDQFMILLLKPKAERGKGYLKIDKNFWMYDPTVGRWERRTERERIVGSDSRRADFDESRLAVEYASEYKGEEKLGKFTVHHIRLTEKPGADVPYPVTELWVDKETNNVLKRQDLAASGKLMRTVYTPKWKKVYSESKKEDVWYPAEIRIYDEVEKDNSTVVLIQEVDLRPLPENIFTKAWLESKSR
ncbi:MAG: outer membrane lipoprotein-sorting protein [Deltaproteobacteria bacterium]|nr:outer membrane lipoprotein-sorting protein [Deltaproteobacteria bacterium]